MAPTSPFRTGVLAACVSIMSIATTAAAAAFNVLSITMTAVCEAFAFVFKRAAKVLGGQPKPSARPASVLLQRAVDFVASLNRRDAPTIEARWRMCPSI